MGIYSSGYLFIFKQDFLVLVNPYCTSCKTAFAKISFVKIEKKNWQTKGYNFYLKGCLQIFTKIVVTYMLGEENQNSCCHLNLQSHRFQIENLTGGHDHI